MEQLTKAQFLGMYRHAFNINNVSLDDNIIYNPDINNEYFKISNSEFKDLTVFTLSHYQIKSTTIESCKVKKLNLDGFGNHITIINSKIDEIEIRAVHDSKITIQNIEEPISKITIQYTNGGKSELNLENIKASSLKFNGNEVIVNFKSFKSINEDDIIEFNIAVCNLNFFESNIGIIRFGSGTNKIESTRSNFQAIEGNIYLFNSFESEIGSLNARLTNEINLSGTEVGNISLDLGCPKISTSSFDTRRTKIKYLLLEQPNVHAYSYNFINTDFDTLVLSRIKTNKSPAIGNDKKLSFEFVTITKLFSLENCVLDEYAIFSKVDLNKCELLINDSSIINAKYYSIRWRDDYKLKEIVSNISKPLTERLDQLWNLRETYRQLKVISANNKDVIDEKQFLKNEVRIYYRVVKNKALNDFRSFFSNFWDFAILWTNNIFSDFGESVWRPLAWLFVINLLLFWCNFADCFHLYSMKSLSDFSWNETKRGIGVFLNLLNPVHSFEIGKVKLLGTADFFMRIFSSYFIFYFVRATRKFHF